MSDESDKWRLAIESLTPGGSEFHNDLERCMHYIRESKSSVWDQMLKKTLEVKELEKKIKQLEKGDKS